MLLMVQGQSHIQIYRNNQDKGECPTRRENLGSAEVSTGSTSFLIDIRFDIRFYDCDIRYDIHFQIHDIRLIYDL